MPIQPLIDPSAFDPSVIVVSQDELRAVIPQRGNWEQLDGLLVLDVRHSWPSACATSRTTRSGKRTTCRASRCCLAR